MIHVSNVTLIEQGWDNLKSQIEYEIWDYLFRVLGPYMSLHLLLNTKVLHLLEIMRGIGADGLQNEGIEVPGKAFEERSCLESGGSSKESMPKN